MSRIKIAGVQMDILFADVAANLDRMRQRLITTTQAGARMTVFPECTTTGYCFESLDEARAIAEPIDGPVIQEVLGLCQEFKTQIVFGFLESVAQSVFNTVVLLGPTGFLASYRKLHLPHLGVDRFTTPGDRPLEVIALNDISAGNATLATDPAAAELRLGMNICYDCSFPESSRVLMLAGADLLVLPTNWPPTSGLVSEVIPNARALENHFYFMSVNRIGTERGISFIGKSKICDPSGRELDSANHDQEAIIYGDIDPQRARQKHLVNIPGVHEVHRVNDRRPDMYRSLI